MTANLPAIRYLTFGDYVRTGRHLAKADGLVAMYAFGADGFAKKLRDLSMFGGANRYGGKLHENIMQARTGELALARFKASTKLRWEH
jgi:hypothetical protein